MEGRLELAHFLSIDSDTAQDAFLSDPGLWLPLPAEDNPDVDSWDVTLHVGPFARTVPCEVGECWTKEPELARRIRWRPVDEQGDALPVAHAFPAFEGDLVLVVEPSEDPSLQLVGSYNIVGGPTGAVLDEAVYHPMAEAAGRRFLEEVAIRVSAASEGE